MGCQSSKQVETASLPHVPKRFSSSAKLGPFGPAPSTPSTLNSSLQSNKERASLNLNEVSVDVSSPATACTTPTSDNLTRTSTSAGSSTAFVVGEDVVDPARAEILAKVTALMDTSTVGELYKVQVRNKNYMMECLRIRNNPKAGSTSAVCECVVELGREAMNIQSNGGHPNLHHILYSHPIKRNTVLIFSEYSESRRLSSLIKSDDKPGALYTGSVNDILKRILSFAIQSARGLEYLHSRGIFCQDFRPTNILIAADESLKITDYGAAAKLVALARVLMRRCSYADVHQEKSTHSSDSSDDDERCKKASSCDILLRTPGSRTRSISAAHPASTAAAAAAAGESTPRSAELAKRVIDDSFIAAVCHDVIGGWPVYWSPEQCQHFLDRKPISLSPTMDMWSWALVVLEMFCGGHFWRRGEVGLELLKMYKNQWANGLAESLHMEEFIELFMPAELMTILERCLQTDPAARFASFQEIIVLCENLYKTLFGTALDVPLHPLKVDEDTLNATRMNFGNALKQTGQLDEAILMFREVLRTHPEDFYAHNDLGVTLKDKGQLDEAFSELQECLRVNPHCAEAHKNLGGLLKDKGLLDESIAEYRETLRIEPNSIAARTQLGNLLKKKGLVREAIEEYKIVLEANPNDSVTHNNLGLAFSSKGRIEEAIQQYEEAIRLNTSYANAHNNLGVALKSRGRSEEALKHYREALRLNPRDYTVYNNVGLLLHLDENNVDDAIDAYKQALKINPSYVSAHHHLGNAYLTRGDVDSAMSEFKEALRINPNHAGAQASINSINTLIQTNSIKTSHAAASTAEHANNGDSTVSTRADSPVSTEVPSAPVTTHSSASL